MSQLETIRAAAEYLRSRLPETPEIALVLGSGLGGLADRIENPKGMNITIVTTATTDKEGKFLLEQLGMPFRK